MRVPYLVSPVVSLVRGFVFKLDDGGMLAREGIPMYCSRRIARSCALARGRGRLEGRRTNQHLAEVILFCGKMSAAEPAIGETRGFGGINTLMPILRRLPRVLGRVDMVAVEGQFPPGDGLRFRLRELVRVRSSLRLASRFRGGKSSAELILTLVGSLVPPQLI